jgi:hypothetical protein
LSTRSSPQTLIDAKSSKNKAASLKYGLNEAAEIKLGWSGQVDVVVDGKLIFEGRNRTFPAARRSRKSPSELARR